MNVEVPNFGELLAPFIGQVEPQYVPNFLALLERQAAQRYRDWADMWPEEREGLLQCAAREDQISDIIEALFPIPGEVAEKIAEPLPGARDLYYQVFDGIPVQQQLAIQAEAELQGAAAWQGMLDESTPEPVRNALNRCSQLEETSSAFVKSILQ